MEYTEEQKTYMNNVGKKSFQWELWAMCNNYCKFCYLGKENRETHRERQLKSLNDCYDAICNLDFDTYNNISLIGGDFWQGQMDDPDVHDMFIKIIKKCRDYYVGGKIGSVWLTCTLTIGDQHHLYEVLDIFDRAEAYPKPEYGASGLWLCTSWDAEGRFHTPQHLANWDYHMKNIHERYPWVKFNTTIILMQAFIDLYNEGKWKPKEFMEEYHTCLFYKQCGIGNMNMEELSKQANGDLIVMNRLAKQRVQENFGFDFFPTRSSFLRFLKKYATEDADTYDRLFNIEYRADELHRNFNDTDEAVTNHRFKDVACESDAKQDSLLNTCGHILNYAPYIDSDRCCICDRNNIWESVKYE